jgi:hypothetical protein
VEENKMTDEQFYKLKMGTGIESKSLFDGEGPPELQALYQKWLNDIFSVKHPEWYSKHVEYYFIYQGIRYDLTPGEFDLHVKADGREGDQGPYWRLVDGARAEALFDTIVTPDLKKLGVKDDEILSQGFLD